MYIEVIETPEVAAFLQKEDGTIETQFGWWQQVQNETWQTDFDIPANATLLWVGSYAWAQMVVL